MKTKIQLKKLTLFKITVARLNSKLNEVKGGCSTTHTMGGCNSEFCPASGPQVTEACIVPSHVCTYYCNFGQVSFEKTNISLSEVVHPTNNKWMQKTSIRP